MIQALRMLWQGWSRAVGPTAAGDDAAGIPSAPAQQVRLDPQDVVAAAYESFQREIYSFALRSTRDSEAAADATQEAFLRLLREDGPAGTVYYVYSGERLMLEYYPAQKKYIEYLYAGSLLISSRTIENANFADADADGVSDVNEFLGLGQPAD